MPAWICATCGTHYPSAQAPPETCVICADERQFVPPDGQRWTTPEQLTADGYRTEIVEHEPGLLGVGVRPQLGVVGHRGLLVQTPHGNVLWDPPAHVDQDAKQTLREAGGVSVITSSHPHMYGAMMECGHAFDAEIVLPEVDLPWLQRSGREVRTWSGVHEPLPGVTLIQCGGHFPGSSVLLWSAGAGGAGALLTGDTLQVTPGQDRVTFLWSAPNWLPMPESGVLGVLRALRGRRFDRIYAGWWNRVLDSDAQDVLERSSRRYLQFLRDEVPLD